MCLDGQQSTLSWSFPVRVSRRSTVHWEDIALSFINNVAPELCVCVCVCAHVRMLACMCVCMWYLYPVSLLTDGYVCFIKYWVFPNSSNKFCAHRLSSPVKPSAPSAFQRCSSFGRFSSCCFHLQLSFINWILKENRLLNLCLHVCLPGVLQGRLCLNVCIQGRVYTVNLLWKCVYTSSSIGLWSKIQ